MKVTITADVVTLDGPRVNRDAAIQALEEELEGEEFDAQNERSENVSVIKIIDVSVT